LVAIGAGPSLVAAGFAAAAGLFAVDRFAAGLRAGALVARAGFLAATPFAALLRAGALVVRDGFRAATPFTALLRAGAFLAFAPPRAVLLALAAPVRAVARFAAVDFGPGFARAAARFAVAFGPGFARAAAGLRVLLVFAVAFFADLAFFAMIVLPIVS
jgi:hypothetical protein